MKPGHNRLEVVEGGYVAKASVLFNASSGIVEISGVFSVMVYST